jgi:valyl-tRNA synthetase
LYILKNSLKMMHPFIPFVTEEIYSKLNDKDACLTVATWPKREANIDRSAAAHMQLVIDVITAIRTIRSEWKLKPAEPIKVTVIPYTKEQQEQLLSGAEDIKNLAKPGELTIDISKAPLKNAATALVQSVKIFVPLEGLVDIAAEKTKKSAEIAQKQKAVESLEGRLNNEAFVSKAPEDIIIKEKERLAELKRDIQGLTQVLANLN